MYINNKFIINVIKISYQKQIIAKHPNFNLNLTMIEHSNKKYANPCNNSLIHFFSLFFQKPNSVLLKSQKISKEKLGIGSKAQLDSKMKSFFSTRNGTLYVGRDASVYQNFLNAYSKFSNVKNY